MRPIADYLHGARLRVWALTLAMVMLLVCLMAGGNLSHAGFTAAVGNNANVMGTGTSFTTIKDASANTLCSSQPGGTTVGSTSNWNCTGNPTVGNITSTVQDTNLTITNGGNTAFTSASLTGGGCTTRVLANSIATGNPVVVRYATLTNQTGPTNLTASRALTINTGNAMATNVTTQANPQTYTLNIWFNTSAKQGVIMEFNNTPNATTGSTYDRILYINLNGQLVFDTVPGGGAANINSAISSSAYTDGAWHMATAVATAAATSNITLYVDGTQVATKDISQTISSEVYNGYWRIGNGSLGSRSNVGSGAFSGSISNATTFPTALTAAQVSTLYGSTSQATYASNVNTLGANNLWPLASETTYNGTPPAGYANPCTHVNVYANDTVLTTPALSSFNGAIPPADPAAAQTLKVGLASSGTTAYDAGLHLNYTMSIYERPFQQQFYWPSLTSIMP